MLAVVTVVDDGGDARRALEGVSLAVFSQFLKAFDKNTVNIDVFGTSRAKNHHIYDVFCPC
jgi:hypothetical protein